LTLIDVGSVRDPSHEKSGAPRRTRVRRTSGQGASAGAGATATPPTERSFDLESLAAEVIATVREREVEARDRDGRWFSLRVRPYFTLDNKIDGAVLVLLDIDAQKRSEQTIAVARDYAEAIVRTAPDPLLILDADLRVDTANEAFFSTFSISPTEAQGRLVYDLDKGQWNIPELRQLLEDILPRNSFFNDFEVTREFATIGRRTMLFNARTLSEASGERAKILVGIRDITKVLHFETASRESSEKFTLLFERSPLPKWVIDLATLRFVDVNEAAIKHYGYTREEFLRMSILDVRTPEAGAALQATLARAPHRAPEKDHCQHRKKNGEVIDVELSGAEIELSGGRIWLVSVYDVTERLRAEKALREAAERFRFMAESMPQKIFTAKPSGDVDYFNPQWTEYTGLTFDQIRDWGWAKFIHPDDVADNIHVWQRSIETGEPFRFEHRFRRADGEFRWHLTRASAFRDTEGNISMWIASSTDIHEVKDANRHKDAFLALLAHELRGPLNPLSNALQIMKGAGDNRDLMEQACSAMERNLLQMTRLVDDLLDVNRISRGKLDLLREQVELGSVVHHVVDSWRPAMESSRLGLTVKLPPQPVYLDADPVRLAQIFGNLLSNACKYSEPGGHIALTAERQGDDVVVSVKDAGIGIPPNMLSKIFELFTQIDQSLERSRGGLGIGLTLVRQLTEMHGGSITAFSEGLGRGSEFVVRLPALTEKPKAQSREPVTGEPASTTARRVLIVDDNRDSAESLAMLLRMSGHETHTAQDGLAAVEAAATLRPDVMLLDIGLPKLNGYDACRRIREQPWGKDIMLVAVTGWGQDEDRQRSSDAGFDDHLVKPVDHATLAKILVESQPRSSITHHGDGDDQAR
jgi:PAS domain S-box-containing protein